MTHRLNAEALRDYDIRGVYGRTIDERDAWAIGRSFATRVRRAGGARVVVGRDGRVSSPALEAALIEGLAASGVDVIRIGLGPSPMLYFAEATLAVDGGIQVTASHNPADHNGFKLVHQHRSFWGDDIQDLARLAAAGDWEQGSGDTAETDVVDAYVARLLAGRDALPAFRIGWDCGNGAAGPVVEQLVQRLPGEHHVLFAEVDGKFPNHHPDPTVEANLGALKTLVADKCLHFGVAFDGDGDRIGAVDEAGRMLRGDQILAILAAPVLAAHPGAPIVADVKASNHLFARIAALGGRPVMARTGHSAMKAKMIEVAAPLAGELSGHIFFADDWYGFDDALYAAIRLIAAVGDSGQTLGDLRDAMPDGALLTERRIPVAAAGKARIVSGAIARLRADGAEIDTTDGARVTTADGWWLLRASNTENALTVQAEADDVAGLDRLVAAIDAALAPAGLAVPDWR